MFLYSKFLHANFKMLNLKIMLDLKDHGIHFMANRWGYSGNSERLYFLGLQNHADGNCSHEIKRCLLLGRKAMTNLDCILKSRDITLPEKVHLVKAMIFPVVMYGCTLPTKIHLVKVIIVFSSSHVRM